MRRILLAVLLFTGFAAAPSAWAAWPIKEFKVLVRPPTTWPPPAEERVSNDRGEPKRGLFSGEFALKVEKALADIAAFYEKQGFRPPVMHVVVDENGNRKYGVYLHDLSLENETVQNPGVRARMANVGGCHGKPRFMEIDIGDWTPDFYKQRVAYQEAALRKGQTPQLLDVTNPDQDLYGTLAHELFHAIQGTYDTRYKSLHMCPGGFDKGDAVSTIVEGGALGAAEYLLSKMFTSRLKDLDNRRSLGGFPYTRDFFHPGEAFYYTNSFWRFLAEKYGGLGYMEYLLRQPLAEDTQEGRIEWLDNRLKTYGPIEKSKDSLYTLFPQAVTQIYSYSPKRYKQAKEANWIAWLTSKDNCQRKIATGDEPVEIPLRDLQPISARCVDIEWKTFAEPVELHIEAIAGSRELADQLHLGMAKLSTGGKIDYCWDWSRRGGGQAGQDSCLEEKLFVQTGPSPDKFAKWWVLDAKSFKQAGFARLIIANIAPPPTPKHPEAPGPQATLPAPGVILRYGVARTVSNDGQRHPPPRLYNPMSAIIPSAAGLGPSGTDPRKKFAMVASLAPVPPPAARQQADPRELLYGIQKPPGALDPKIDANMVSFQIGEPGEKHYIVSPGARYNLGYTGPFQAVVSRVPGETYSAGGPPDPCPIMEGEWPVSSLKGQESPQVIGEVVESTELELRIRISTELYTPNVVWAKKTVAPGVHVCAPGFSGEKHRIADPGSPAFSAELILPFGWRYFAASAPKDIVTPGVEIYMARYGDRMQGVPGVQSIMDKIKIPGGGSGGGGGLRGRRWRRRVGLAGMRGTLRLDRHLHLLLRGNGANQGTEKAPERTDRRGKERRGRTEVVRPFVYAAVHPMRVE